jgi:hypothetical protein
MRLGRRVTFGRRRTEPGATTCEYETTVVGPNKEPTSEYAQLAIAYIPAASEAQFQSSPDYTTLKEEDGVEGWAGGVGYFVGSGTGNLPRAELMPILEALTSAAGAPAEATKSATVAPTTKTGTGALLPESATAGEVVLAYVHAYASKDFALVCEYDPQLEEAAAQKGGCARYLHELDERQEKGEAEGVVPESLPGFVHARLKSEVAMPEGDEAVTVVAPTTQGEGEVKILARRTGGSEGPWRIEE